MKTFFFRFMEDMVRIGFLMLIVGVALYKVDPANEAVFQALGISMFLVGGTHLTRRILFHKLDLQDIAKRAIAENSVPAAIIFATICAVIVAILSMSMAVLK